MWVFVLVCRLELSKGLRWAVDDRRTATAVRPVRRLQSATVPTVRCPPSDWPDMTVATTGCIHCTGSHCSHRPSGPQTALPVSWNTKCTRPLLGRKISPWGKRCRWTRPDWGRKCRRGRSDTATRLSHSSPLGRPRMWRRREGSRCRGGRKCRWRHRQGNRCRRGNLRGWNGRWKRCRGGWCSRARRRRVSGR